MEPNLVKAIGQLLAYYQQDLQYFTKFSVVANNPSSNKKAEYCQKDNDTFRQFIIMYRVARNTSASSVPGLLDFALNWYAKGNSTDVDTFAEELQISGLSRGQLSVSLSSKVMYLMNPVDILPYDSLAKAAVGYKGNNYRKFRDMVENYRKRNKHHLQSALEFTAPLIETLEKPFVGQFENLDVIRENRLLDKWLWVVGNSIKRR